MLPGSHLGKVSVDISSSLLLNITCLKTGVQRDLLVMPFHQHSITLLNLFNTSLMMPSISLEFRSPLKATFEDNIWVNDIDDCFKVLILRLTCGSWDNNLLQLKYCILLFLVEELQRNEEMPTFEPIPIRKPVSIDIPDAFILIGLHQGA